MSQSAPGHKTFLTPHAGNVFTRKYPHPEGMMSTVCGFMYYVYILSLFYVFLFFILSFVEALNDV